MYLDNVVRLGHDEAKAPQRQQININRDRMKKKKINKNVKKCTTPTCSNFLFSAEYSIFLLFWREYEIIKSEIEFMRHFLWVVFVSDRGNVYL
jgi:hypothetical protein